MRARNTRRATAWPCHRLSVQSPGNRSQVADSAKPRASEPLSGTQVQFLANAPCRRARAGRESPFRVRFGPDLTRNQPFAQMHCNNGRPVKLPSTRIDPDGRRTYPSAIQEQGTASVFEAKCRRHKGKMHLQMNQYSRTEKCFCFSSVACSSSSERKVEFRKTPRKRLLMLGSINLRLKRNASWLLIERLTA